MGNKLQDDPAECFISGVTLSVSASGAVRLCAPSGPSQGELVVW